MSTKRVVIESDERLEGVLQEGAGNKAVVICHPHPLYGGSMSNNVVDAIENGFFQAGFTTLKFNFRGVGASTGGYAEGDGEVRDALAAYDFLKQRMGADGHMILAGYSFGAWICSKAAAEIRDPVPATLFLVAYPFAFYSVDELGHFSGTMYLVGGSLDDISPLDNLLAFYKELKAEKYLKVLPSSHFFEGREKEIAGFIVENFAPKTG